MEHNPERKKMWGLECGGYQTRGLSTPQFSLYRNLGAFRDNKKNILLGDPLPVEKRRKKGDKGGMGDIKRSFYFQSAERVGTVRKKKDMKEMSHRRAS